MKALFLLRIDVGCGGRGTGFKGFIGIDMCPIETVQREKDTYIQRDVVGDGLPFEDNSVDVAVCAHMLEHMPREDALKVMKEICRVLKLGCRAYVSVPDLRVMVDKYLEQDWDFYNQQYSNGKQVWAGPTITDRLVDSICGMGPHGHRYAYDNCSLMTLGMEASLVPLMRTPADCPYKRADDYSAEMVFEKSRGE